MLMRASLVCLATLVGCALLPAFAETYIPGPLPAEFGGGSVPANQSDFKAELAVDSALMKVISGTAKCDFKGVKNVFQGKDSGLDACLQNSRGGGVFDKYFATLARIEAKMPIPSCLNAVGLGLVTYFDIVRDTVNSGIFCSGATNLPTEFGDGFVPPDEATLQAELAVGAALTKLGIGAAQCYQKGAKNVSLGKDSNLPECLTNGAQKGVLDKYQAAIAKINAKTPIPMCLDAAAVGEAVADAVQGLNPVLFCAP